MPATTLRDIARRIGVSATTVSKALRNHPKVGEARKAEILALARRLGYRPNPALSAWMRHVRDVRQRPPREAVAYVTAQAPAALRSRAHWSARYRKGAAEMATRLGYGCETVSLRDYDWDWDKLFRVLHHRGVRGVAIEPLAGRPAPGADARFCLASVESLGPGTAVDWVATDHYAGMLLAVERALARGHRRIGYVSSFLEAQEHERWRAAFALFQTRRPRAERVPVAPALERMAEGAMRQWWRRHAPTVIIGSDNSIPARLEREGVRVPRDVAFISLDQEEAGRGVAGVAQQMEEVGEALIRLLALKLDLNERGAAARPRSLLIQPGWVEGASLP